MLSNLNNSILQLISMPKFNFLDVQHSKNSLFIKRLHFQSSYRSTLYVLYHYPELTQSYLSI